MFLILNHAKRVVDITAHAQYVRRQNNGIVVGCAPEGADAIYSSNTDRFFPLEQTGYIGDGHTLVAVDTVPAEVEAGYYFYHAGEFYSSEGELARLEQAKAASAAPLVASIVFVQLAQTEQLDDVTITEHAELFPVWDEHFTGKAGTIVSDEGSLYRSIHDVGAGQNTKPSATPSMWTRIGNPAEEWPEWIQPIGSHDAYEKGAKVTHKGSHWVSTAGGNVWEPGVYGWAVAAE